MGRFEDIEAAYEPMDRREYAVVSLSWAEYDWLLARLHEAKTTLQQIADMDIATMQSGAPENVAELFLAKLE